jgi:hypothetical protein|tara:strand:- start:1028 stop:1717 length:690 start_codon:yes stop_codon:yes gene_type:complete
MKSLVLAFFFIITFLDSYFYGQGLEKYQFFFEPLIVPSILVYYLLSTKKRDPLILLGFLFVWVGDLLLLIELSPVFLQWAVFCYWLMQLCFIGVYRNYWKQYSSKAHLLGLLFWGSYLVVFLNHVYSSLGDMKVHGLVYGVTLSAFGSLAIMELLRKVSRKHIYLVLGLLVFSVRDVFLTYNKKYFNEDVFTFSIPILHGIGFFIIIKALLYFEQGKVSSYDQRSYIKI